MPYQDLLSGLVELHVLYHAVHEEIYGLEMIEELERHGYHISPGTLYPLLHRLTHRGYLKSREMSLGRTRRRLYRATAKGRKAHCGNAPPRARADRGTGRAIEAGIAGARRMTPLAPE
jgi:DNA-binding MarR family transcriptional regulator